MSFFDLNASNIRDYLMSCRQFPGMWFFHHVPKTAGSSLSLELENHCKPYANIRWDYEESSIPFYIRRETAVSEFVERIATDVPRSASGHILAGHVDAIEAVDPNVHCFTFLRNPVQRVISEYNYCCSEGHPPREMFMAKYPTIEDFVHDPVERNRSAKYLLDDQTMSWTDVRDLLARRYQLIGIQERYPVSFLMLSAMMTKMRLPEQSENVAKTRPKVDAGLARMIVDANELDFAIYDSVSTVYHRISDSIWDIHKSTPRDS
ncbi:MAG: hypothetical protein ABJO67_17360 [Pseudoruegeria sp.]